MEILTDDNFLIYCAKHYTSFSTEEFLEDLQRVKYIKKLITIYTKTGKLQERLVLNHLIILNNVFGPQTTCKIIFLKLKDQLCYIKPFLLLLNILPDKISGVGNKETIYTDEILMDQKIIEVLRKI